MRCSAISSMASRTVACGGNMRTDWLAGLDLRIWATVLMTAP
jgi:hypothetical protein